MASWGNATGAQFQQDMDSDGHKLAVHGGAGAIGDFRVLIQEHTIPLNKALRVEGGASMQNINNQTAPVLKVEGNIASDGTTQRYQAEIIANNVSNALRVDGELHIWRGGAIRGRFTPGIDFPPLERAFAINMGASPTASPDPDIIIGQASPNGGNVCFINSRLVSVGGSPSGTAPNDEYPVDVAGPLKVGGVNGVPGDLVAIKTDGLIISTGIKLPDNEDEICVGQRNRTTGNHTSVNIGEGAGTATGRGSQVNIRGDLTVQAGDGSNPGDLTVPRHITLGGTLTANSIAFIQGPVSVATTLNAQSGLSVGTLQQPADAAVTGNLTANGDATVNGVLEIPNRFKVTEELVNCTTDLMCESNASISGKLDVSGAATLGSTLTVEGDTTLNGKLDVANAVSLNEALTANASATFNERTHHLDGVAVSSSSSAFSGMIKQNDRLEFILDGTLRFYVDATGGHDA